MPRLDSGQESPPANLSDPDAVDGLIEAAEAAAGAPIDILVANAGITKDGLLMRMKDDDWSEVLRVNLESYFRLSRAAMRASRRKRAVNFGSPARCGASTFSATGRSSVSCQPA